MEEKNPWSFVICTTCQNTLTVATSTQKAQLWGCRDATEQTAGDIHASARKGCLICAYLNRLANNILKKRERQSAQLTALQLYKPPSLATYHREHVQSEPSAISPQPQGKVRSLVTRLTSLVFRGRQNNDGVQEHSSDNEAVQPKVARQNSSQELHSLFRRGFKNPSEPTLEEMQSLLAPPSFNTSSGGYTGQGMESVLQFRFHAHPADPFRDGHPLRLIATISNESVYEELRITEWTSLDDLGIASLEQAYTGSDETIDLARTWFGCCTKEHVVCNQDMVADWYPTRLIALNHSVAKVIDCERDKPTGEYACLSYCWGGQQSECLTIDTVERWRAGVPFAELSATFRHAMEFVQRLGIAYIWIDRFCILQGDDPASVADWETQSKQMFQIYGNGTLTVVAAHASTPVDGCFVTRRLKETRAYALMKWIADLSGDLRTFRVMHQFGPYAGCSEADGAQNATSRRAWCVQEIAFSRRIVSFASHGIEWRCAHGPGVTEARPSFYTSRRPSPKSLALTRTRLAELSVEDVHRTWYSLIGSFTHRELSRPIRDKLRAMEGIVTCMQMRLHDEYVYGHFVQSMPRSLCWSSLDDESERSTSQTSERILPSWSWAATDGRKSCYPYLTGQRSKGASMSLATMIFPRQTSYLANMQCDDRALLLLGRVLPVRLFRNEDVAVVGTSRWRVYGAVFDIRSEQEHFWKTRSWLYILPIEWLRDESIIEPYLMLVITERGDGAFRRVGVVQLSHHNHATTAGFRRDRSDHVEQATSIVGDGQRQVMSRGWFEQYQRTKPVLVMLS